MALGKHSVELAAYSIKTGKLNQNDDKNYNFGTNVKNY